MSLTFFILLNMFEFFIVIFYLFSPVLLILLKINIILFHFRQVKINNIKIGLNNKINKPYLTFCNINSISILNKIIRYNNNHFKYSQVNSLRKEFNRLLLNY